MSSAEPGPSATAEKEKKPLRSPTPPPQQEPRKMELVKIPEFGTTLSGADNFHEWATEVKTYFELIDFNNDNTVWDLVTGVYPKPDPEQKAESKAWIKANGLALLAIKRNCEPAVKGKIATHNTANGAYIKLTSAFEGKWAIEFWTLLASLVNIHFDDREKTISEHIMEYEKIWGTFTGIITNADTTEDNGFGKGLQ